MPYLEETGLYDQIDFNVGLEDLNADSNAFKYHHIALQTFVCPSDIRVDLTNSWYGARGNYAANVGRGFIWMDDMSPWQCDHNNPWDPSPPHIHKCTSGKSSLAQLGVFLVNYGRKISEVTDGTSKTVAVSEIRKVEGVDTRGTLHFSAGVMYMHELLPNDTSGFDRTRYCINNIDAPCLQTTNRDWSGAWFHTSRSAHPGGVNVMFLDSSVRFVNDTIDANLWQIASTPDGDEIQAGEI